MSEPITKDCPRCGGQGRMVVDIVRGDGIASGDQVIDCPDCYGKGEVEVESDE